MHQNKVISRMNASGLVPPIHSKDRGICFGLTEMFIHACHSNQLHPFFKKLRAIKDDMPLSREEEVALFEGISYYQSPHKFKKKLLPDQKFLHQFQDTRLANQLFFKPHDDNAVITMPLNVCIYKDMEPKVLLDSLHQRLSVFDFTIGFSMRQHKFAAHYNSHKKQWYWFDPSGISTTPLSTQAIIDTLCDYHKNAVMRTSLAITKKYQTPVEKAVVELDKCPLWQSLTPVGEKAHSYILQNSGGLFQEIISGNHVKSMEQVLSYLYQNRGRLSSELLEAINFDRGIPPLHLAVMMRQKEMVEVLLAYPYTKTSLLDCNFECATKIARDIMHDTQDTSIYDALLEKNPNLIL